MTKQRAPSVAMMLIFAGDVAWGLLRLEGLCTENVARREGDKCQSIDCDLLGMAGDVPVISQRQDRRCEKLPTKHSRQATT
jgi:hypothetical protein